MTPIIGNTWSRPDGSAESTNAAVERSLVHDNRVVLFDTRWAASHTLRLNVDELLEAIYEGFPERRPGSSEQTLGEALEAAWEAAEEGVAEEGDLLVRYWRKLDGTPVYSMHTAGHDHVSMDAAVRILERAKPKDPEWYSARVVKADGVYYLKADESERGADWIDHCGTGYKTWEVSLLAGEGEQIEIIVGADD